MESFSPELAQRPMTPSLSFSPFPMSASTSTPTSILRPRKRPRRTYFRFADLTADLQVRILDCVSLRDLHNARLAGLPTRTARPAVRDAYLHRVRQIELLRPLVCGAAGGADGDGASKRARKMKCLRTPLEFSECSKLILTLPDHGALPDSISELGALRILNLQLSEGAAHTELPGTLLKCTKLRTLTMSYHWFPRIPLVVTKLWRLQILDLSYCTQLEIIPPYFGRKLPELVTIDITGCAKIHQLPKSLLKTLNRNTGSGRWPKPPLKCSPESFPRGYLATVILKRKFPHLTAACEDILKLNEQQGFVLQPDDNVQNPQLLPVLDDVQ